MDKLLQGALIAVIILGSGYLAYSFVPLESDVPEIRNAAKSEKLATILDEYSDIVSYNDVKFSPDRTQVLYRVYEGERNAGTFKVFFVLGDEVQKKYDFVSEDVSFLPNGEDIAYIAEENGENFLVLGDKEGQRYPKIKLWNLYVSSDMKRFAYSVIDGDRRFVVIDGKEGKSYDLISDYSIVFSPDSRRLAYIAKKDGQEFVVINGEELGRYDEVDKIVFSPDSQRIAYTALKDGEWFMVIDGNESSKKYDFMTLKIIFSPDSKELAYVAGRGNVFSSQSEAFLVIGDKEVQIDGGIEEGPVYSPVGNSIAYIKDQSDGMFLVLDGKEFKKYYWILAEPIFSPDGKKVAYRVGAEEDYTEEDYLAGKAPSRFVVVDDKEEKSYDDFAGTPVFSPDSQYVAYAAIEYAENYYTNPFAVVNYNVFTVVNGREGKIYDMIWDLNFIENGKYLEYGARIGNELWWLTDEL